MFRKCLLAIGVLFAGAPGFAQEDAQPVEVMVLGTFHFANPGRDVVNMEVDDVLAAKRQSELQAIAKALAAYNPDRIVIEYESSEPDLSVPGYREFGPEVLATTRNESVQIGYRLAAQLGHEAVYGFDEQPGEGEPDYFPFGPLQEYAQAHGQAGLIEQIFARVQAKASAQEQQQATATLPVMLLGQNDEDTITEMHNLAYNGMLAVGDAQDQPGADLNAMWFLRNAKMFAKMGLVAEPGDRVLIIVGSGHKFWLDHLARNTPGYESVSPVPYLEMAERMVEGD